MDILLLFILIGSYHNTTIYSYNITKFEHADPIALGGKYEYRNPNLGIYAAEAGAALLLGNVAAIGAVYASLLLSSEEDSYQETHIIPVNIFLYPAVYPFAGALGVHLAGRNSNCPGSFWGAVGGGCIGIAAGLGTLYLLNDYDVCGLVLTVALPPILSTVGYNVFGVKPYSQGNLPINVNYPTIHFTAERNEVIVCQKISLRIFDITF